VSFSEITPKPITPKQARGDRARLVARVGLAFFAMGIVLGTSALVVLGATDEPRPARIAAAANASDGSGSTSLGEAWRERRGVRPSAPEGPVDLAVTPAADAAATPVETAPVETTPVVTTPVVTTPVVTAPPPAKSPRAKALTNQR
jgi:hypothetical protein